MLPLLLKDGLFMAAVGSCVAFASLMVIAAEIRLTRTMLKLVVRALKFSVYDF